MLTECAVKDCRSCRGSEAVDVLLDIFAESKTRFASQKP
jgi:hypothetical protein